MSTKFITHPWFYFDDEQLELPNSWEGMEQTPRIGEEINFPKFHNNKHFKVVNIKHSFREDNDNIIVHNIHIYVTSIK